jgi:hypothetical protein
MIVVVVTFAVHSAVDWVYFVPGEALIALLCAGWVAGRGPWQQPLEPGERSLARLTRSPIAAAGAATAIALALVVAWSQWQPLRSEQAATAGANELGNANAALISDNRALVKSDLAAARADDLTAIARDPLDVAPRADLAGAYNTAGQVGLAQRTLERAVQLQPSNAVSWFDLWQFDSGIPRYAKIADQALAVTYHLDPYDPGLDESGVTSG